jgi:hypothetical protein
MYADLDIEWSRPWVVFAPFFDSITISDDPPGGNGNGIPEAGETMNCHFRVNNEMGLGFNPTFSLSANVDGITWITNDVPLNSNILGTNFVNENDSAIMFSLPSDWLSKTATFTLTTTSDIGGFNGNRASVYNIDFPVQLGPTQILLVDDDNGNSYEDEYKNSLDRLQYPYDVHTKATQGSPSATDLQDYPTVIWFTGTNISPGTITAADVTALKTYLDSANGNLFLSSLDAASQLHTLDSAFMADYLHAIQTVTNVYGVGYVGDSNSTIFDGVAFSVFGSANILGTNSTISPYAGGTAEMYLTGEMPTQPKLGTNGVAYADTYRVVFNTFGFEFLHVGDDRQVVGIYNADTLMQRVLDFFRPGMVTDVPEGVTPNIVPDDFALEQNYPNPFNPSTKIQYTITGNGSLKEPVATRLVIYNIIGREVKTLVDEVQLPGTYTVEWDGRAAGGNQVATGIYLYRLEAGEKTATKKMVLLK